MEESKTNSISQMIGATLTIIKGAVGADEIVFCSSDGRRWVMNHLQDCCESVYVEDIAGDLSDLIGSPIVQAEESSNKDEQIDGKPGYSDSFTWTFYRIATAKGLVVIRWLGESNGYYSESVDFYEMTA